jgi:hypothetical protein
MHNACRDSRTIKIDCEGNKVRGLQEIDHTQMGFRCIANWIIWNLEYSLWGEYALNCNLGEEEDH